MSPIETRNLRKKKLQNISKSKSRRIFISYIKSFFNNFFNNFLLYFNLITFIGGTIGIIKYNSFTNKNDNKEENNIELCGKIFDKKQHTSNNGVLYNHFIVKYKNGDIEEILITDIKEYYNTKINTDYCKKEFKKEYENKRDRILLITIIFYILWFLGLIIFFSE